jgi:hypothetical protein
MKPVISRVAAVPRLYKLPVTKEKRVDLVTIPTELGRIVAKECAEE